MLPARPGRIRQRTARAVLWLIAPVAAFCARAGRAPEDERTIAFQDVAAVAIERNELEPGWTVVVQDGLVAAAGPSSEVSVPAGARTIPGRGYFLMPGLIDMHAHVDEPRDLPLYLAAGVTTLRNMKGDATHIQLRNEVAGGRRLGPTIYTTGPFTNEPAVRTRDDARRAASEHQAAEYDFIKVHDEISAEAYETLIEEGKRLGIPVVGHPPPNLPFEQTLRLAPQTLEHVEDYTYFLFKDLEDSSDVTRWAEAVARSKVPVTPTLSAYASLVAQVENVEKLLEAPWAQYMSPYQRLIRGPDHNPYHRMFTPADLPDLRKSREFQRMLVARLHEAGATVLAGTDACNVVWNCGAALHDELESFVALGFMPHEALRAATVDAARALGKERELGTIAAGKRADLLLLEANPLDDVRHARRIVGVMVRGRWLSSDTLRQQLQQLADAYRREEALAAEIASGPIHQIAARLARLDIASMPTHARLLVEYRVAERFAQLAVAEGPDSLWSILGNPPGGASEPPFSEAALNRVGYVYLTARKSVPDAIRVFQLNTLAYPDAFNTWDSLGEAYLAAGDTASARSSYRRSLELNPDNVNARAMLQRLP